MTKRAETGVLGEPAGSPTSTERIVILVPWRGGDDRREWLWDICRPWLERFGWPIFTGDSVGPWARAAAVNAAESAAEAAGGWDLALVADTDTIRRSGLDLPRPGLDPLNRRRGTPARRAMDADP